MKRGKKYIDAAKTIDRAAQYDTEEAISLVKKSAVAKFDETRQTVTINVDMFGRETPVELNFNEVKKLK